MAIVAGPCALVSLLVTARRHRDLRPRGADDRWPQLFPDRASISNLALASAQFVRTSSFGTAT